MKITRSFLLVLCLVGASCGDDGLEALAHPGAVRGDDADGGAEDAGDAPSVSPAAMAMAGAAAPAPAPAKSAASTPAASKAQPAAGAGGGAAQPSAAGSSAHVQTPSAAGAVAPKPGEVETVAMDLVYSIDLGGNPVPDPRPIILFKDGWATKDINYFVRGLDIPAHKMMFPNTWIEWQLVDDKIALKNSNGGFTKMYFQNRYEPNSSSLTFEQKFTRLLTGVNVPLGTSAVVQKDIQFWHDHRVVAGSYTALVTPSTVNQVVPPESRGTYRIDGYTMELAWDDGTTKKTSFVWSEKDPEAIYIDGLGYIVLD